MLPGLASAEIFVRGPRIFVFLIQMGLKEVYYLLSIFKVLAAIVKDDEGLSLSHQTHEEMKVCFKVVFL